MALSTTTQGFNGNDVPRYRVATLHDSLADPSLTSLPASARVTYGQLEATFYVCGNTLNDGTELLEKGGTGVGAHVARAAIDSLCGDATETPTNSRASSVSATYLPPSTLSSSNTLSATATLSAQTQTLARRPSSSDSLSPDILPRSRTFEVTTSVVDEASPTTENTKSQSSSVTVSRSVSSVDPLPVEESWLRETRKQAERGATAVFAGGGSILSPKAGGQAGVAMAVLRISQLCAEENADNNDFDYNSARNQFGDRDGDDDSLDEPLSPFIHPLSFAVGTGPYRYFLGAIIGNCFVLPLATFIIFRGPLYHVLKRWLLPGDPSPEDVFHFMGWPSVLALPLSVLAEGTMTVVVELFRSGGAVQSMAAIVGCGILLAVVGAWVYVLYRLYRLPIALERAPFGGWVSSCWPFAPLWERAPATNVSLETAQEVESMLERMAHFFGDGVMLWAELGCIVCSLIVGGIEGASTTLPCKESTPVLLAFALLQSILSCMTMVPGEFVVQLLIAVCLALLSVSAVMDAYGDGHGGGFLSANEQEALGLTINILSFFGVIVGFVFAVLKLFHRWFRVPERRRHLQLRFLEDGDDSVSLDEIPTLSKGGFDAFARNSSIRGRGRGGGVGRGESPHSHSRAEASDPMDLFLGHVHTAVERQARRKLKHGLEAKRAKPEPCVDLHL